METESVKGNLQNDKLKVGDNYFSSAACHLICALIGVCSMKNIEASAGGGGGCRFDAVMVDSGAVVLSSTMHAKPGIEARSVLMSSAR
ncbi:hypothetical protein ACNKHM_03140 [Shigella sonnei]